jgi:hypothetical protein
MSSGWRSTPRDRAALTPEQAQRRYVGLTALRWSPLGLAAR